MSKLSDKYGQYILDGIRAEHGVLEKATNKMSDQLFSEFARKKAAMEALTTTHQKSGKIDSRRLSRYNHTNDIFKSQQIKPQGVNHSVHLVVDWSASFDWAFEEAIEQMYAQMRFFDKAGIKYTISTFTSDFTSGTNDRRAKLAKNGEQRAKDLAMTKFKGMNISEESLDSLRILRMADSTMPLQMRLERLATYSYACKSTKADRHLAYANARRFDMARTGYNIDYGVKGRNDMRRMAIAGNTPTTATMCALKHEIARFDIKHRIENSNVVIITDGRSNDTKMAGGSYWANIRRDYHGKILGDTTIYDRTDKTTHMVEPNDEFGARYISAPFCALAKMLSKNSTTTLIHLATDNRIHSVVGAYYSMNSSNIKERFFEARSDVNEDVMENEIRSTGITALETFAGFDKAIIVNAKTVFGTAKRTTLIHVDDAQTPEEIEAEKAEKLAEAVGKAKGAKSLSKALSSSRNNRGTMIYASLLVDSLVESAFK